MTKQEVLAWSDLMGNEQLDGVHQTLLYMEQSPEMARPIDVAEETWPADYAWLAEHLE